MVSLQVIIEPSVLKVLLQFVIEQANEVAFSRYNCTFCAVEMYDLGESVLSVL